ncbi:MAG: L-serine ammonia-lyase, iron-sulfur-dependent, subunit alpha [Clostridia bacterium]
MQKTDPRYSAYLTILNHHLVPAMGCTEPIAIAYAAAIATRALGKMPEHASVLVSGSILKNAKSVTVPNTAGQKGIGAACAAGIIAGDPAKELQVLSDVNAEQLERIEAFARSGAIVVELMPQARLFDILVTVKSGESSASARIADRHTNVVRVERNNVPLYSAPLCGDELAADTDEALLTIEGAYDFASSCDIADVRTVLDLQIEYNTRIAREGITGEWGACVGKLLLECYGDSDVRMRAKAYAAAGSDARMSGCELPVVINSGSGNQGITVSVPVIEYARALGSSDVALYRALVLSNLAAIRQKALIGCLSAYCGAISAGCAAGAGIAYLLGGDLRIINHTIVNSLAILSGTICDGAKPSCAAKIACAVDAGLMGYQMALHNRQFRGGEGIVTKGIENTIRNVGRLGRDGMRETNEEILKIMTDC